jgi:hypothetical protein
MLKRRFYFFSIFFLTTFLLGAGVVSSQEFNSTDYKVLDPVMNSGGFGSSPSFRLFGSVSQISIGTSTSLSFGNNAGFLYFPFASSPAVSATAGDGQVSLSWSASTGYLGWTASSYSVAQSSSSGGPYTYSSLGNVVSSIRTGLSNGIRYYFVIVAKDVFDNSIASSTEIYATPVSSGSGGGGGGGGGGGSVTNPAGVMFSGRAYPLSKVNILEDGQLKVTTIAGPDSNFSATINNLSAGDYTFSVYGEDKKGIKSDTFTFSVFLTAGVVTKVGGIFLAPTIAVDKSEVKKGDNIAIFGQSTPTANIVISVNSENELFVKTVSDAAGVYLYNFDTVQLEMGNHSTKSKAAMKEEISPFSKTVDFKVGTQNILAQTQACASKGDLNEDCHVNLVDFSIAAFWYKKTLSTTFKIKEKDRLNGDGKVDLVDFSIMAYYWTG